MEGTGTPWEGTVVEPLVPPQLLKATWWVEMTVPVEELSCGSVWMATLKACLMAASCADLGEEMGPPC